MPTPEIFAFVAWEDSGPIIMARITGNAAANITQASMTGINLTVMLGDTVSTETAALTVSSVVFDTLQKTADDARWTADTVGYNFKHEVAASTIPDGEKSYLFEFVFDPVSGEDFPMVVKIDTLKLRSQ